MSAHHIYSDYATNSWQVNAFEAISTGGWERALQLWAEHAAPAKLCVWLAARFAAEPIYHTPLLEEIRDWPTHKSDALRWRIFSLAEVQGFDTLAGALGLSLFWSDGSMSPEGFEPVFPESNLSRQMNHCVLLMWVTQTADNPNSVTRNLLTQWINQENK